jgi:hypothetical protein
MHKSHIVTSKYHLENSTSKCEDFLYVSKVVDRVFGWKAAETLCGGTFSARKFCRCSVVVGFF